MLVIVLFSLALADIPVHCLRDDFAGSWEIRLGVPVAPGKEDDEVPDFMDGGVAHKYCFSGHPNKNSANMKLPPNRELKDAAKVVGMHLTLERYVSSDLSQHLVAESAEYNGLNSWTTVYDEGWEARLHKEGGDDLRLMAFAHYTCATDNDSCGQDGVGIDTQGRTAGYLSQCGQTLVGWYEDGDTKGCFYGSKVSASEKDEVHSVVVQDQEKHHSAWLQVHTAYHQRDFVGTIPDYGSVLEMHNGGRADSFTRVRRAASIKSYDPAHTMHLRDECAADEVVNQGKVAALEKEHPNFDWREQLEGKWDTPVRDQGSCGSCYAIAAGYMLEARANIALHRHAQKTGAAPPQPLSLSPHAILACSYFNQGCEGGYPYLVAKHAQEFGVPKESCMPYDQPADGEVGQCDASCQGEHENVYANQYNYAGGFYGACGQERIMASVMKDGPIAIALEVPGPFQTAGDKRVVGKSYLHKSMRVAVNADGTADQERGASSPEDHTRMQAAKTVRVLEAQWTLEDSPKCQSNTSPNDVPAAMATELPANSVLARKGDRFALDSDSLPDQYAPYAKSLSALAKALKVDEDCVKLRMADGSANGWEYTNHAIVVVGWGQNNQEDGSVDKYWIVRNSWGSDFGDEGYAYIARGVDYAGLESQAVELKVDTSKGLLKQMMDEMGPQ